jgi:ribonuclease Y
MSLQFTSTEFITGFAGGIVLTLLFVLFRYSQLLKGQEHINKLLEDRREELENERRLLLNKAKEEMHRKRTDMELEAKKRKIEIQRIEMRIQTKTESLTQQEKDQAELKINLEKLQRDLSHRSDRLMADEGRVKKTFEQLIKKLEQTSNMSQADARRIMLESLRDEVKLENQQWLNKVADETREKAKEKSVQILCTAMQRYLSDQIAEHSSCTVMLPNEEMKGRIIGKEGRNIKALEMATGMEFVIGETPEAITISGFNPIRREVARQSLLLLIQDGRINPSRIEEIVAKCEDEINDKINEIGQQTALEFGFPNMHKELRNLLGKLYFRTSYTQNVLDHCKEVAHFARSIANELGLDGEIAARCGLLHDIGKAVSSEVDGPHALIGADLAKKHGESAIIVNAIAAHHEDEAPNSIYAIITMIADAISASRVGARKETLSAYVKRLEQLEEIAGNFDGVKKAYALQAGREIRIIVDESLVTDEQAMSLARDIAAKVETEMNFPGQIKVNVIRETRAVEYAR